LGSHQGSDRKQCHSQLAKRKANPPQPCEGQVHPTARSKLLCRLHVNATLFRVHSKVLQVTRFGSTDPFRKLRGLPEKKTSFSP
jgi:hypothetical protein